MKFLILGIFIFLALCKFSEGKIVSFRARHFLDHYHGYISAQFPDNYLLHNESRSSLKSSTEEEMYHVVDGHLLAENAKFANNVLYLLKENDSQSFHLGKTLHIDKIALHLESHAFSWVGWKHVASPLPIKLVHQSDFDKLTCDRHISGTSVFFGVGAMPMYGHVLFNAHSPLFYTLFYEGLLEEFHLSPNNRSQLLNGHKLNLFAAIDHQEGMKLHPTEEELLQEELHLEHSYSDLFRLFSRESARSSHSAPRLFSHYHLVRQSRTSVFCLDKVSVGLQAGLDHYNTSSLTQDWRLYSSYLFRHYNVTLDKEVFHRYYNFSFESALGHQSLQNATHRYFASSAKRSVSRKCRIVLMNRQWNRKIVNAEELMTVSRRHFPQCTIEEAIFESMSFEEQLRLMANVSILIGMDGSGLLNAAFLLPCSSVVRVFPWGCAATHLGNLMFKGRNFQTLAMKTGGHWTSFEVQNRSHTFVPSQLAHLEITQLLEKVPFGEENTVNLTTFNNHARLLYFLNQDSYLDPTLFLRHLKSSVDYVQSCRL